MFKVYIKDTRKMLNVALLVSLMLTLKLVSTIFYQICIFSPNDSPSTTMKNVFHFI